MKKLIFLITFTICTTGKIFAAPSVSIQSDAQPREIYIGDPIMVAIAVSASTDVAVSPYIATSTVIGDFELLAQSSPTFAVGKDGRNVVTSRFAVTTFSTGPLIFPSLPITLAASNGQVLLAQTETVAINVKSLLAEKGDEGNIRPLKGLYNFKSYFWLWMLLLVVALGTGGYFLWKWANTRRTGATTIPIGPPRPPEEIAWEAIHALEDADLPAAGQIKEFYYRLSVILREYLENRYRVSALDKTTSELLMEFRRMNFTMELMDLCRNFFDNADLVKFAKFTPMDEEVSADLNRAKQFINLTTPKKVEPETREKIPV